jgi:hypothetical protein
MWGEVDEATKEKWKEPEFVKSKIEANRQSDSANQPHGPSPGSTVTRLLPKSQFKLNEWARELKQDVSELV